MQNVISSIKFKLTPDCMALYNDLLILELIAPNLCKDSARKLLAQFKKMEKAMLYEGKLENSMVSLLKLLSSFKDKDPLLHDFVRCTVKDPTVNSLYWYTYYLYEKHLWLLLPFLYIC